VIVRANRDLGPERILRTVAERAPHGFADIKTVLSDQELASIGDAYQSTTSIDVATLNKRKSWTPAGRTTAVR